MEMEAEQQVVPAAAAAVAAAVAKEQLLDEQREDAADKLSLACLHALSSCKIGDLQALICSINKLAHAADAENENAGL